MSDPEATLHNVVDDLRHEWWSKKSRQVYARFGDGSPDAPVVWLADGTADKRAPFDPSRRTYRQLAKAGQLWCPVQGCAPFETVSQGVKVRSHFRHEKRTDQWLHRGGPESVWHQQAKFAIHDWLATVGPPVLEFEYNHLPVLNSGRHRCPDVYVEFEDGARVAFECQQQSMAGTDPEEHRAQWQTRIDDYHELRKTFGLQVVWLVSPWATSTNPKYEGDNVWRIEVFGSYAATMLEKGATVYWIDPTFSQIGTLLQHVGRPGDLDLPRGYLQHAREFPKRGHWSWLHSDNIIDCDIDPLTGIVTTPSDLKVQGDQWIADLHVQLEAERAAARAQQAEQRQAELEAKQREYEKRRERERQEREKRVEEWNKCAAANAGIDRRIRADYEADQRRKALVRAVLGMAGVIAVPILFVILVLIATK